MTYWPFLRIYQLLSQSNNSTISVASKGSPFTDRNTLSFPLNQSHINQFQTLTFFHLRTILISYSHLRLGRPSGHFPSVPPNETLCTLRAAIPTDLTPHSPHYAVPSSLSLLAPIQSPSHPAPLSAGNVTVCAAEQTNIVIVGVVVVMVVVVMVVVVAVLQCLTAIEIM